MELLEQNNEELLNRLSTMRATRQPIPLSWVEGPSYSSPCLPALIFPILLTAIQRVLDLALDRIDDRYTKNEQCIKWSRVAVQAVSAGNAVLRDQDLEELAERIKFRR